MKWEILSSEKKPKSREDWKKLINNYLTPKRFEELCYDIVSKNGFINTTFRGGGPDGGRDLEAIHVYKIAKKEIREKCWFQCKRQKQGVSYNQISTEVSKAQDQGIRKFFILSNQDTTPDCKDDIYNWNKKNRCYIHDLSGIEFLNLLFELPDVLQYYFPDEEIPPIGKQLTPEEIINKPKEIGKRLDFKFNFTIDRKVNMKNVDEVLEVLKEGLLKLDNIDLNLKSLIYQKISFLFFGNKKAEDALLFLEKSLEITPKNIEALLNKGYILGKINRIEESTKCYDEILGIESKNKFALNNLASNLERTYEYKNALKMINKALKVDSKYELAIYNKSAILRKLGKYNEAKIFLEQNEELVEKSIFLKLGEVDLLVEILDLKAAFELNEEILSVEPKNIQALNNRGVIYEKNSKFENSEKYRHLASKCFEVLIDLDVDYPIAWSNKAVTLINNNELDEAQKFLDKALEKYPGNPHLLRMKGITYHNRKDYKNALSFIEKSLEVSVLKGTLFRKALILYETKKHYDAEIVIKDFLKIYPADSDGWFLKGKIMKAIRKISLHKKCIENGKKYKIEVRSLLDI